MGIKVGVVIMEGISVITKKMATEKMKPVINAIPTVLRIALGMFFEGLGTGRGFISMRQLVEGKGIKHIAYFPPQRGL